ncbi:MAG: tellurite resistance TerB family protein [Thauera phenolivorans]|uniref:Tellurite resistance TerB family protein n=1 Tax=Thauera phenolivorans TaxID=1792543 RepID=A0A7X7LV45_9RHOO|nr:tellurite resistance TerB family protein [Thauera phenolivorans]
MNLGNILGQLLQGGMASQSRSRLEHAAGAQGAGGLGDLLGAVLGGGASRSSSSGGLGDLLGGVLGGQSGGARSTGGLGDLLGGALGGGAGGRPEATGGGLGDLLGGLLGGGASTGSSSARSSALGKTGMAILATIAMAALKNRMTGGARSANLTPELQQEASRLTTPGAEELVLRAMISAAKADSKVDEAEVQRLVGRIDDDGVSAEEKEFLMQELRKPLDIRALVADVNSPALAAEVYAASLLAIDVDTQAEADYLRTLAAELGLDDETVAQIHELTGAPRI